MTPPVPPRTFGRPIPPCPKCHSTDMAEEEEQTGSSQQWFVCNRCGTRYNPPPAR